MTSRDARTLARLHALDRTELLALWSELQGAPPPRNTSQRLMRQAIAYRLQCRMHGGLKRPTAEMLSRVAATPSGKRIDPILKVRPPIKPGTRFIRDWHGETHEVTVDPEGRFLWRDKPHASLSVIAREITGTRRNGPAFFGLRSGASDDG